MFIKITNPANPLRTENFLRPYKRGEQPFTPEVVRQVLIMTNHKKNIYDMLQLIAEQPQDQQNQYKEIILSAFDHREQPADTLLLGKKLAAANGFEDELNETVNHDYANDLKDGIVYASSTNQVAAYINTEENPNLFQYPENINLICTNDVVKLSYTNLFPVKSLKFKEGAEVSLFRCINLPADLDVSMCDKVETHGTDLSPVQSMKFKEGAKIDLSDCINFPVGLDFSLCDEVDLHNADLSTVKNLKFKDGAKIDLSDCKNLPADLDVSMCDKVDLHNADLSRVKSLKFKKEAKVDLRWCRNLPADLDFSLRDEVDLHNADLSTVKNLKFKEGATVNLSDCINIPAGLDFSLCDEANLTFADLSTVKNLKFKEGAKVDLRWCRNLPADLDFSMCDKVDLHNADLSQVKSITFKNEQQKNRSISCLFLWHGKITYTDTEKNNIFSSRFRQINTRA